MLDYPSRTVAIGVVAVPKSEASLENSIADFNNAREVLGASSRPDERLELLRAQTDLILALHWHQVDRVAGALMERRILIESEILELCKQLGINASSRRSA